VPTDTGAPATFVNIGHDTAANVLDEVRAKRIERRPPDYRHTFFVSALAVIGRGQSGFLVFFHHFAKSNALTWRIQ
jgi:hypothetical protein